MEVEDTDRIGRSKFYFGERWNQRSQTKEIPSNQYLPVTVLKNGTRRKEFFCRDGIRNGNNDKCGLKTWNRQQKAKLNTNDFFLQSEKIWTINVESKDLTI